MHGVGRQNFICLPRPRSARCSKITVESRPVRYAAGAGRVTLYASDHDRALRASKRLHGGVYSRAGEAGDDILIANALDTIDASAVKTNLVGPKRVFGCRSRGGPDLNVAVLCGAMARRIAAPGGP